MAFVCLDTIGGLFSSDFGMGALTHLRMGGSFSTFPACLSTSGFVALLFYGARSFFFFFLFLFSPLCCSLQVLADFKSIGKPRLWALQISVPRKVLAFQYF
jgi:hypothetical protein